MMHDTILQSRNTRLPDWSVFLLLRFLLAPKENEDISTFIKGQKHINDISRGLARNRVRAKGETSPFIKILYVDKDRRGK